LLFFCRGLNRVTGKNTAYKDGEPKCLGVASNVLFARPAGTAGRDWLR
jgi:hypothetical protein